MQQLSGSSGREGTSTPATRRRGAAARSAGPASRDPKTMRARAWTEGGAWLAASSSGAAVVVVVEEEEEEEGEGAGADWDSLGLRPRFAEADGSAASEAEAEIEGEGEVAALAGGPLGFSAGRGCGLCRMAS